MARDAPSPKKQKPLVLSPTAKVEALFRPIAAAPGELLALAENGVRFFDRGGTEVARDHVGESSADYIVVSGDSLVAWQRHSSYAPILADCAKKTASVWADGKQLVIPRFAPAGPRRFVAYDSSKLFVVGGDCTAVAVDVAHLLGKGQHIGRARMFDDDILVEICGPQGAKHYFHTALVGRDGTERWRLAGNGVTVHQGSVLLFADAGVLCVDGGGRVIGRVDEIRPQSGLDYLEECFLLDGDDVFVASGTSLALLRPHESKVVWSTELPTTSESIKMPVLAKHDGKRVLAAS